MSEHRLKLSVPALAWRQGWRDFRAGELRLLMVAVVLAVAALSAVGFFATRLDAALARDAAALLGGDAVVASDQPAPAEYAQRASASGLRQAQSTSFPSMARAPDDKGGAARLLAVKAVSSAYPLRGTLRLRASADGPAVTTAQPQEAVGQDATFEKGVELVLDELRLIGASGELSLLEEGRGVLLRGHLGEPRCICDRPLRGDEFTAMCVADGSLAATRARQSATAAQQA